MNHGLPQFLGTGLSLRLTNCGVMGCAVIVKNQWMIRRDIGYTLLKVADWVATSRHYVAQELVRVGYCASGAINKPVLNASPRIDKACAIARSKRPDVQALHAFRATVE